MKRAVFFGFACILFVIMIFSYIFVDHNFFYLKNLYSNIAFSHRLLVTAIYASFVVLFFIFYFLFLKLYKQNRLANHNIKILIGITIAVLLVSYPAMLSSDMFNYIATAKVTYFYGENPYVIMPIEFVGDSLLQFTHAANKIALYGPFWIFLTYFPHVLGFGNYLFTMFLFKTVMVAFFVATIWMIHKITHDWYPVLLFALNPLVITETLLSAHNDIIMMFLAVIAVYLLHTKRIVFGVVFLVLSVLIKYATVFLVPVFFYILWQKQRGKKITWENTAFLSMIAMFVVFLLSPIREEMYPWYFIWPFTFAVFQFRKKFILNCMIAISFGLMFRYMPFMLLRTHFGPTPLIKLFLTFTPLILVLLYYLIWQKRWQKIFSH